MQLPLLSHKASRFTESVIRGMSVEAARHKAVNLAQGMPDFPAPEEVKAAACRAIQGDVNQYAVTWGAKRLREAIAEHAGWHRGRALRSARHHDGRVLVAAPLLAPSPPRSPSGSPASAPRVL